MGPTDHGTESPEGHTGQSLCSVTLLVLSFHGTLVWWEEEETTPQRYAAVDNNPVIFSALVMKRGESGGVETIMRSEKWRLSLHTFGGSNNFSCSLLIFENLSGCCHSHIRK